MELAQLGWSDFFENAARTLSGGEFSPARVCAVDRGSYLVWDSGGQNSAQVTGNFRHRARNSSDFPVTGDWVLVEPVPKEDKLRIHHVLPRRTSLSRNSAGTATQRQVLAANVDTIFVAASLGTALNSRRIERYLTAVADSGAMPFLLLTKADLCENPAQMLAEVKASNPELAACIVCSLTGQGLKELDPLLQPGHTSAIIGPSGVGKSTLINSICGEEILDVLPVREEDQKGRHTTTRRELILLPQGGLIIDTPGLRELQLWEGEEGLHEAFPDIEALALACRFSNCQHQAEPGCAVRRALQSGELQQRRFESYNKLKGEIAQFEVRRNVQMKAEERRRSKQLSKDLQARLREKNRDA